MDQRGRFLIAASKTYWNIRVNSRIGVWPTGTTIGDLGQVLRVTCMDQQQRKFKRCTASHTGKASLLGILLFKQVPSPMVICTVLHAISPLVVAP